MKKTGKQVVCLLVCLLLLVALLPRQQLTVSAEAAASVEEIAGGTCGENLSWSLSNTGTLTISGTGPMKDYNGMEGGGYTTPWYYMDSWRFTDIVIEEGVTSIGNYAFVGFRDLNSISIPSSVTSIGRYAFMECISLKYVIIPERVTSIDKYAFRGCKGLMSVAFLGSAPEMGSYSFQNTTATVYHPCDDESWTEDVKKDYGGTITWVGHIYRDYVPCLDATCTDNAVVTGTCRDCGATGQVPLPDTTVDHSPGADGLCTGCGESPDITVELMSSDPFGEWHGAALEIYIDNVLWTSATLEEFDCYRRITIPYTPGKTYLFQWIDGSSDRVCLVDISVYGTTLLSGRGIDYSDGEIIYKLDDLHFHQYQVQITPPACTIPGSVTHTCATCGDSYSTAFYGTGHHYVDDVCTVCQHVYNTGVCGEDLRWKLDRAGTLTVSGTGPMYHYSIPEEGGEPDTPWDQSRQSITKVVIEPGATSIGEYAFHGCQSITEVTVPESVTDIGKLAFYNCTGLTEIALPEGVTTIGSAAFRRCSNLTAVTIPESVTTIGKIAFFDCTGLTEVTVPEGVTSIGEFAFGNCTGLSTVTFSGSAPVMDSNCFKNVTATAVYDCDDETWTDSVKQNYGGKVTWEADHSFGDYLPDENATCTADGTATGTCLICGTTETKTLPGTATGHIKTVISGYKATCTENGLTDGVKCSVCNATLTVQKIIPAIGHDYRITEVTVTCTDYGYDLHQCQNCGDSFYKNLIDPTGHSYENGICTACGQRLAGDVTGDGKLNIMDVARLYAHIKGTGLITDVNVLITADYTGDGKINILDIAGLYAHVQG